jgi:molybdate transport system substrate-binding protein
MTEPLKVITTVAMQGVIDRLTPAFTQAAGRGVVMAFGPPSAVVKLVREGESADVVISNPEGIEDLVREGKVDRDSRRIVARMIIGLAVGLNEPKPAIGTAEEFKQALLQAKSIIHADPTTGSPSAAHFLKVIERLGIADEIKRKTTLRAGVVAHAVASGECAMAAQQLAELLLVEGVHVLGPFPDELQNVMPLAAAVHTGSAVPQAATALIDLMAAPATKAIIERAGLLAAP